MIAECPPGSESPMLRCSGVSHKYFDTFIDPCIGTAMARRPDASTTEPR
ncbi:hypothetical protein CHELA17_62418 [Chelatococcus asaccharovorans]|nr:hypothetical protein CHELA17_62418 [Chelatococcus asaccharovorans]